MRIGLAGQDEEFLQYYKNKAGQLKLKRTAPGDTARCYKCS